MNHLDRFTLLPQVGQAIRLLNQHEIKAVVITNQSGVARGYFPESLVHLVHQKMQDLLEMENAYLAAVGRPATAIFQRELGASWDVFTLGPYRDWRHYAERDLIAPDRANAAAKAAGFASDEAIGPYMRSLINTHHDTLGTVVR